MALTARIHQVDYPRRPVSLGGSGDDNQRTNVATIPAYSAINAKPKQEPPTMKEIRVDSFMRLASKPPSNINFETAVARAENEPDPITNGNTTPTMANTAPQLGTCS